MSSASPFPDSPAMLKMPLLNPRESSPSAEIVPDALMVIRPASPTPKVLASATPPPKRDRLVVVISIPPALPSPVEVT